MRGAATVKARLLTVESLTEGTTRQLVPAECSVRRPCRSATGTSGPRYRGALPCNTTLYVSTATLYSIRCVGAQPMNADECVSDVVCGSHMADQPCLCSFIHVAYAVDETQVCFIVNM